MKFLGNFLIFFDGFLILINKNYFKFGIFVNYSRVVLPRKKDEFFFVVIDKFLAKF